MDFIPFIFNGLSISSILLLTAIGLSIVFGMMGVINFAHGEFIMIGCYSSYIVSLALGSEGSWLTLFFAFIISFVLSFGIGFLVEKFIIKRLYARPLDSILATWGVSLILQQLARNIFGSNNVDAPMPKILNEGWKINDAITLPYNRILIIFISISICLFVYYFMYKTPKGRILQSVMQNRSMASCIGINTKKADSFTFSFGCGLAGIAGICISMLGSIGPSTGQNYIIDTFLVVILGGIGGLRGSILGALLIGMCNPFIEYYTTSSMAKVIILVMVLVTLQYKPQGLSPMKDRTID
ncbi:urea ABC transporter permease subunit UrtB [Flavobacterium faecale]|uniref:Urea ABC transporter permease subunit UrtB n=1 Tax=Flavobacterium faecale TaxID=1355330 RepID=A0A2S1LA27_9FLAO|nr:urea ABC transporter permease subunit UrtB [Flavobacterium faecale]AWG20577.1 urea ABC transporter permease subunit UrtB [Flavobacterium faecale]